MTQHDPQMGEFVRTYQPARFSGNRMVNDILAPPRWAFHPMAIITMQKRYPDASYWQGEIDWDKMRSQTDTVVVRGAFGTAPDTKFLHNWTEAKKRGMTRGAYLFYNDTKSPGAQAETIYNLIRNDPPEMEITVDWENTYNGAYGGLKNVVSCMEAIEAKMGKLYCTETYTGYYWFREHSNAITNASQYNYLKQRNLWLAWYTSDPAFVKVPGPWTSLTKWQFGTPVEGYAHGAQSKEIDMNWYNGTLAQFANRYGGAVPPPPTGPTLRHTVRVYSDGSINVE